MHKRLGDLVPGGGKQPLHRAPRNTHAGSSFFLCQSFGIAEIHGFHFIVVKFGQFKAVQRDAGRSENSFRIAMERAAAASWFFTAW
jgi:hypothetical protein